MQTLKNWSSWTSYQLLHKHLNTLLLLFIVATRVTIILLWNSSFSYTLIYIQFYFAAQIARSHAYICTMSLPI